MTIAACPPSAPIVPGIVVFDGPEFLAIYPEFTTAATPALQNNFNLATIILSNCCGSPVFNPAVRQSLLYMLTAHITFLNTPCGANNDQPPGVVGRIDSAAEGSVSVSAAMEMTLSNSYFMQTKYGAQFWQSTASFRTMHYVPPVINCGCGPLEGFGAGIGPMGTGYCGYNGGSA